MSAVVGVIGSPFRPQLFGKLKNESPSEGFWVIINETPTWFHNLR